MVGKVVKVTGVGKAEPKPVWSNTVKIYESTKSGQLTYKVECTHPLNSDDIDTAFGKALQYLEDQLNAEASSKARSRGKG